MGRIISLIIVGLVLMFAEIMIIPGVGFAGILGVAAMGGSCYYAFHEYGTTAGYITLASIVLLMIILIVWSLRSKTWKKMALDTNITSKAVVPETEVKVGDKGVSVTRLAPMGNARFGTDVLEVTALEGMIANGKDIEVAMLDGQKIYVKESK